MAHFYWYLDPHSLIIKKNTCSKLDPLWHTFLNPRMKVVTLTLEVDGQVLCATHLLAMVDNHAKL